MENVKLVTIEEVCISGSSNISQNKLLENEGDYPIYGASGLIKNVDFYHQDRPYLSIVKDGSGYGRITIMPGKTSVIGTLQYILPKENIMLNYLYYAMLSIDFKKYVSGAAIPHIYFRDYKKEVIILRPLEEQQKIVEKLDKAFELIDQAKANIEQNIINAKELFQSKLDEVFTNNESGWELKKLSELCDAKDDIVGGPFGSNLKVEHYRETGVPILRLQNIGKGYFINKDIKYVDDSKAEELSYHSFRSGDIALAKLGIPIGKTCIIPDEFSFGIVVADVVRIRPSKDIDKNFLVYFLNSNTAVRQLTGNIKGATRPRVNLSDVRNMKISIPNHLEQLKLSNYINNIESSINNLLSSYENKLSNLEELRKSILEKAFKGELTN